MGRVAVRHLGLVLAALVAAGAADILNAKKRASSASYDVSGRRYHVLRDAHGYKERGVASWYGRAFHGRRTASGEIYDMHAMTAAHRTLPIPTDVQVTNPRNGKTVIVRVNDRGPFRGGRIIDLSYSAARALGLVRAGTGVVEIRAVAPKFVQVGAYADRRNADRMRRRLEAAGFDDVWVHEGSLGSQRLSRVQLGPIADRETQSALVERLAGIGIGDAFVAL